MILNFKNKVEGWELKVHVWDLKVEVRLKLKIEFLMLLIEKLLRFRSQGWGEWWLRARNLELRLKN